MKSHGHIFNILDVLKQVRINRDSLEITFLEEVDGLAKLTIHDCSADSSIVRYVQFVDKDTCQFEFKNTGFEDKYNSSEIKIGKPAGQKYKLESLEELYTSSKELGLSVEAKAEFEEMFASQIMELQSLRKKGKQALIDYRNLLEAMGLNNAKGYPLSKLETVSKELSELLDSTELTYSEKELCQSLELLSSDKFSSMVENLSMANEAYQLEQRLGGKLVDYAKEVASFLENRSLDAADGKILLVSVLCSSSINDKVAKLLESTGETQLPRFSLALAIIVANKGCAILDVDTSSISLENFDNVTQVEDEVAEDKWEELSIEDDEDALVKQFKKLLAECSNRLVVEDTSESSLASNIKDLIEKYSEEPVKKELDERAVVSDYMRGISQKELVKKYAISVGSLYTILGRNGVQTSNSKVAKRVAHIENDEQKLKEVIMDYSAHVPLYVIYEKHGLYKNGLFYLLDKYQVPRRGSRCN